MEVCHYRTGAGTGSFCAGMSAENPTVAELLTAVNAAIYALVTRKVSSYTVDGVTYNYHDLKALRELRKELREQSRTSSGSIRLADISG